MARPKFVLPGKDLVVRKLVLNGVGDKCVGTDESGKEYEPIIFLGPRMTEEMDASLEDLGEESFYRLEGFAAVQLCGVARWEPALLDARPNQVTR